MANVYTIKVKAQLKWPILAFYVDHLDICQQLSSNNLIIYFGLLKV